MKKLLFLFFFLLYSSQFILAQKNCDRWYFGANYTFLQPISEFADGGFNYGNGVTFDVFYDLSPNQTKVAFHSGLHIGAIIGKGKKDKITLADPAEAAAKTYLYNAIFDVKLLGRVILFPQVKWSPYVEGFGGLRTSAGHERINLIGTHLGYEDVTSEQVVSNVNWVFGGAAGILFRLSSRVDLDLRASFDHSPKLEYINMDSYEKIEENLIYDFSKTSGTDYTLHIGFRVKIGCDNSSNQDRKYNQNNSRRSNRSYRRGKSPTKKTPSKTNSNRS